MKGGNLHDVGAEKVVGRVLVNFSVIEDFIAVDSPFAGNPHMEVLVEDALLWELLIHVKL